MRSFYCQKFIFIALLSFGLLFSSACGEEEQAKGGAKLDLVVMEVSEEPELVYEEEEEEVLEEAEDEGGVPMPVAASVAASVFPGLSSTAYAAGYCRSTANDTPVYTTSSLADRLGTIYALDEVYFFEIAPNASKPYAKVTYPVGTTRKTGYIHLSSLTLGNFGERIASAKASATVYRRPGEAVYGSIYVGDDVRAVAKVSGYVQVFYKAASGNRAWKIGYVTQAAYDLVKGMVVVSSWQYPMAGAYCTWKNPGNNMSWGSLEPSRSSRADKRDHHVAIDIAGSSADVVAAADGWVASVQRNNNSANGVYVVLSHSISNKTVYSFYAHLQLGSVPNNIAVGSRVDKGQKIGIMGTTAGTTSVGRHLHFSIADKADFAGYVGYVPKFSGDKVLYGNTTFYNPVFVIRNGKLP